MNTTPEIETPIIPFDYQETVIDKLMEFVELNQHKPNATGFVVMPGGSGKTIIFSDFTRRLNVRTFIVSPTLTISDQNMETMCVMNKDAKLTLYNGEEKDLTGDVIFTTYHSLVNLLKKGTLPRDFARVVIFDEVHMSLSFERSQICDKLDALCIGFTATDIYSIQKNVEKVFKNEIYRMMLKEAIEMGILLPLRGFVVETKVDLRDVNLTSRNQLDEAMADKHLNVLSRNKAARDFYLKNLKGVPAVAFCINIKHADSFTKYLNEAGIRAAAVHSGISPDKRRDILKSFERGELDILCTKDVLIQGWDSKRVVVALTLRPVYSWVTLEQLVCRVVRLLKGKECGVIVHFQDIYSKKDQHILVHHLFNRRTYTQGGFVHAPKAVLKTESKMLESKQAVNIFGSLKVSSVVQEVVNLRPIIFDIAFANKKLIASILLSRRGINYLNISMSTFLSLNFNHSKFKGNGRRLILKHLGVMWNNTSEDYLMFIEDILGEHLFQGTHDLIGASVDEVADPDDYLVELFTQSEYRLERIQKVLTTLSQRESDVLKMYFGIEHDHEYSLDEIADNFGFTRERIRQIKEKSIERLRNPSRIRFLAGCLN